MQQSPSGQRDRVGTRYDSPIVSANAGLWPKDVAPPKHDRGCNEPFPQSTFRAGTEKLKLLMS